jgi:hypothetical protein
VALMADGGGRLCCSGTREGKVGGFYRSRSVSRRFVPGFVTTVATAWRRGGWRRAAVRRPMAEGGSRAGECGEAVWHRPRLLACVTGLRRTVAMVPGLRPRGILVSRRARAGTAVGRRGVLGATSCGCRRSGSNSSKRPTSN